MDTQNVEFAALSDDQLDAVSGGDGVSEQAKINQQENLQRIRENQQAAEATKVFSQVVNAAY